MVAHQLLFPPIGCLYEEFFSECYFSKFVESLGFKKLFNYVGFAAAAYNLFIGHRLGHCSTCDGQGEAAG